MYPMMQDQDMAHFRLTQADRNFVADDKLNKGWMISSKQSLHH